MHERKKKKKKQKEQVVENRKKTMKLVGTVTVPESFQRDIKSLQEEKQYCHTTQ